MKRYYWAAKAVTQLNQILLLNIEAWLLRDEGLAAPAPRPINERFFDKDGGVRIAPRPLKVVSA